MQWTIQLVSPVLVWVYWYALVLWSFLGISACACVPTMYSCWDLVSYRQHKMIWYWQCLCSRSDFADWLWLKFCVVFQWEERVTHRDLPFEMREFTVWKQKHSVQPVQLQVSHFHTCLPSAFLLATLHVHYNITSSINYSVIIQFTFLASKSL